MVAKSGLLGVPTDLVLPKICKYFSWAIFTEFALKDSLKLHQSTRCFSGKFERFQKIVSVLLNDPNMGYLIQIA